MRIALVSTPFVAVPPPRYGGTELIVAELAEGLMRAGHRVTLFATGDSRSSAEVRARYAEPQWPPHPAVELEHAAWALDEILSDARGFDLVHAHVSAAVPLARFLDVPLCYTIHHDRDEALARLYRRHPSVSYVAVSGRQRQLLPEAQGAVVIHHGLSAQSYPAGSGDGGYALFLGRFSREKGVHRALDAARAGGMRLTLAGRPHWCDDEYYQSEVVPRLVRSQARLVGEVGGRDKARLLGGALALLFPVCWEEPFGLVMIEAMLCGTPVLAFPRGSVLEVVEDAVTGFVCADEEQMAARLGQIARGGFDRRRCRARALERWSARRMLDEHLALYQQLYVGERVDARSGAPF